MRIFSGAFKGRILKTPKGYPTRPTKGIVREALFNICQNEIQGTSFLDLFAGYGSIGFEALSRGAKYVVFVEKAKDAVQCLHENLKMLHVEEQTLVLPLDVFAALSRLKRERKSFDLIYIDPPYDEVDSLAHPLLQEIEKETLLTNGGTLFLETSTKKEMLFETKYLKLKDLRTFGISRLYQFTRTN